MLVVVDIGNTNISLGIYDQDTLIGNYRMTSQKESTSDEYGVMIIEFLHMSKVHTKDVEDVIISSVVPKINYSFSSACIKYLKKKPIFVGPGVKTGINIKIDNPASLGADRLVDAAGAFYKYGCACLVIDFGTATTFDIVSNNGEFLGGATAAGIGITAKALSSQAAQLPEIEISKPNNIIAKNTINSMQAGVVYGYIGQTEYIIQKLKEEYGQDLKVVSTGGLGRVIYNETELIDEYDQHLTFYGLKIIYDKNKSVTR